MIDSFIILLIHTLIPPTFILSTLMLKISYGYWTTKCCRLSYGNFVILTMRAYLLRYCFFSQSYHVRYTCYAHTIRKNSSFPSLGKIPTDCCLSPNFRPKSFESEWLKTDPNFPFSFSPLNLLVVGVKLVGDLVAMGFVFEDVVCLVLVRKLFV